jgi:hypothetical protein
MADVENHYNDTEEDLAKALANGYVTYGKWTGAKDRHVSAREFNERASTYLPAIKSALESSKRELAKQTEEFEARLARQTAEFDKRITVQQRIAQDALVRQRRNLEAEYEAKKLAAVDPSRRAEYLDTLAQQREAFADIDSAESTITHKQQDVSNQPDAEMQSWLRRNTWVNNPLLYATAHALGERYAREKSHLPQLRQLELITEEVIKKHPDLMREYGFDAPAAANATQQHDDDNYEDDGTIEEQPRRVAPKPRRSSVEGVGSTPGSLGSRAKGWKDIPQTDRDVAFVTFIKPGIYGKDEKAAKDAYAKTYWQMYGDK